MTPGGGETFSVVPVGRVRSPFRDTGDAPHQGRDAGVEAVLEIFPPYTGALDGLDQCERLVVLCWLHLSRRDLLKVHPRGDAANPLTGVFATRSPLRPNPLAVYTVDLLEVKGNLLRVRGLDAVDGTPVVDIRPRVERLDG